MTIETPLEIEHVPTRLRADFTGKIPESTSGDAAEREKNFLSRALAAYAVYKLSGCTVDEAAKSVVDGGGDGGIDAIYFAPTNERLWVVQSKYIETGRGEPSLGDVSKFKNGLENLLQGQLDAFEKNAAWNARLADVRLYLAKQSLQVRAALVYSGIHLVSEDRLHLFEELTRRFSSESEYFEFRPYNLTSIHDWLTGADEDPGVPKVELDVHKPGWVTSPYETVYGLVKLSDLAALEREHKKRLVAANIRHYKGATEVNDRIVRTLNDEPEHLFYLNNGLTAFCQRLHVDNTDRGNAEKKRVTAYGISIVNGAQTLGSIAQCFPDAGHEIPDGFAFLKIISLERCVENIEFAKRITQSTNFQNQIGSRDFAALDEQQERIARQLLLAGITYHYKDADDEPDPDDTNFTFLEAIISLACMEQDVDCDFVARVLANRRSLWALGEVASEESEPLSRYRRLFRPDRSARTIWRAVQTERLVITNMKASARASNGVLKTFYENARWLVLNLIFLRQHPEQGDELTLPAELVANISADIGEISTSLWEAVQSKGFVSRRTDGAGGAVSYESPRHLKSVFCAASDCKLLRNGTLAQLASRRTSASESAPSPETTETKEE